MEIRDGVAKFVKHTTLDTGHNVFVSREKFKKITAGAVLHDDANAIAQVNYFFDFADVWVVQSLEYAKLALKELQKKGIGECTAGHKLAGESTMRC